MPHIVVQVDVVATDAPLAQLATCTYSRVKTGRPAPRSIAG